jgi:hypothetical protein
MSQHNHGMHHAGENINTLLHRCYESDTPVMVAICRHPVQVLWGNFVSV